MDELGCLSMTICPAQVGQERLPAAAACLGHIPWCMRLSDVLGNPLRAITASKYEVPVAWHACPFSYSVKLIDELSLEPMT